jgi:DNA polymerase IV
MTSPRRIAHLDMDAFFASVELLRYPQLKGHPVVVGGKNVPAPIMNEKGQWLYGRLGQYAGRGVVTTSTYEARALGVFSGMGLMQSAKLAPQAILLPANFEAYRSQSRRFKQAVLCVAPVMEDRGIDEIYLDLTDLDPDTVGLAQRIKKAVFDATGLTCSIGITPNKLLSKICSDLNKPDGLTLLSADEIATRIWPLPASKVNGIGPKATRKLAALGIQTIGDLAQTPMAVLQQQFGRQTAQWLHEVSHGVDDRPVVTYRDPKSLSRETTLDNNLHVKRDRQVLTRLVDDLCRRVAQDLAHKERRCKTVGIKVKFADFSVVTRDITLPVAVDEATAIREAVSDCLKRVVWHDRIRLLGVRASGLVISTADPPAPQLPLWTANQPPSS